MQSVPRPMFEPQRLRLMTCVCSDVTALDLCPNEATAQSPGLTAQRATLGQRSSKSSATLKGLHRSAIVDGTSAGGSRGGRWVEPFQGSSISAPFPRVATVSQPWADGYNRVAVGNNSSLVIGSQVRIAEHGGCMGWRGHQCRCRNRIQSRIDLSGKPTYTSINHED